MQRILMNMRVYIKGNPCLQINEKVQNSRNGDLAQGVCTAEPTIKRLR